MKLNKLIYLFLLFLSPSLLAIELDSTTIGNSEDEDYYMFPIRPNEINTIAGNMGELRASHFHAGLDIRTGGRTGLPVYAAADGYISRVAVKSGGYGKALYITHTNGETTVYAHLDRFNGPITDYVKDHQYAQRNLYLNKYFKKGVFNVAKGDIIAISGNSGSSAGPHLHFEIRDKDQQILNPLKYHFEEIRDTTPPSFTKLAITPKNIHSRISGVFDRSTYKITKQQDNYVIKDTIIVFGAVGFELLAHDKLNDANYKCGISQITFELDNELIFRQKIDTINFSSQRNILTHYNYPAYVSSGKKYHKLYLDDGNKLPFYTTNKSKGILNLNELGVKHGVIKIYDVLGNKSTLDFILKVLPPKGEIAESSNSNNNTSLFENTLIIRQPINVQVSVELDDRREQLIPSYSSDNTNYFLWDLRRGIPRITANDSITLDFGPTSMIIPNKNYTYYSSHIDASFNKSTLFDTLYFSTSYHIDPKTALAYYTVGNPSTAILKNSIRVSLKSDVNKAIVGKNKASVYRKDGQSFSYIGGNWSENGISFKTRSFGDFVILTDSIAPTISPIHLSKESVKFKINDSLSGIKKFDVFVNNEWVLMDYDYKTSLIWSDKSFHKLFIGDIRLRVIDNTGNEQTYLGKIPN